ncbi:hypothetical protein V5799_027395 [Amblyomma americanum]|uniref:BPTI/Kunitz inhibitor domain-containing protein n=1 Tax=Amblyomma americanum TaxID=6943 RepID=A0AAQ4DFU9_AMBAM
MTIVQTGASSDGFGHTEAAKLAEISGRDLSAKECDIYKHAKSSGCQGQAIFRFGYNKKTKSCEDYITLDCFREQPNEFSSRTDCYRKCNSTTICLRETAFSDYSGELRKWYQYNEEDGFCEEFSSTVSSKYKWPFANLFGSVQECNMHCAPTFHRRAAKGRS